MVQKKKQTNKKKYFHRRCQHLCSVYSRWKSSAVIVTQAAMTSVFANSGAAVSRLLRYKHVGDVVMRMTHMTGSKQPPHAC